MGGFLGVAVTGDSVGFFVGAFIVWFLLTIFIVATATVDFSGPPAGQENESDRAGLATQNHD
jgi:hypothetical protein